MGPALASLLLHQLQQGRHQSVAQAQAWDIHQTLPQLGTEQAADLQAAQEDPHIRLMWDEPPRCSPSTYPQETPSTSGRGREHSCGTWEL